MTIRNISSPIKTAEVITSPQDSDKARFFIPAVGADAEENVPILDEDLHANPAYGINPNTVIEDHDYEMID